MIKKTLNKKTIFRLIQIIFLLAFIFLLPLSIWAVLYEDDMPFIGFFWLGVLVVVYWVVRKVIYYNRDH